MSAPAGFPLYYDGIYHVSLTYPSDKDSDISKSIGVTSSYPLLIPNLDYLSNFIKGDIGISNNIKKESLFKNLNDPSCAKNENVFKKFAELSNIEISDINKYKKDGKFKIPKEDINISKSEGTGLSGFEKTLLTSIFETQKPYIEISKLVISNIAKLEDVIARVMPLVSINPLSSKSQKPSTNAKSIGYQNGKQLSESLSKLQQYEKIGSIVKIDKNGNSLITKDINSDIISSDSYDSKTKWETISIAYSTGVFKKGVDYRYTYINIPDNKKEKNENFNLNIKDNDIYYKFRPKNIILGIFKNDGTPLNPNETLKTIGINDNGDTTKIPTKYKKADWILDSPKWKFRNGTYQWPTFSTPIFEYEGYGDDIHIKKYKKGDKNRITNEVAIEGDPVINGFMDNEISEYKNFFSDIVNFQMYLSEDLDKEDKDKYANEIINKLNIPSHMENVFLYGQLKSSTYKSVMSNQAFPEIMRKSFKPFEIFSEEAANDDRIKSYNLSNSKEPGSIWIDPESDYDLKVIRVDPTTKIKYEDGKNEINISSTIKSFLKNRTTFKLSNNSLFNISISKNNDDYEYLKDIPYYTLDNWNYFKSGGLLSNQEPIIQNDNIFNIRISGKIPTKYYSNIDVDIFDRNGNYCVVNKKNDFYEYLEFKFEKQTASDDISYFINNLLTLDIINKLYIDYKSNIQSTYTYQMNRIIKLKDLFDRAIFIQINNETLRLKDNSMVKIDNNRIIEWIYSDKIYDYSNLPLLNKEKIYDFDITSDILDNGELLLNETDISINGYNINVVSDEYPYGKIIDPSKISNNDLKKNSLFSDGKYGHGDISNPQEIGIINRYMLTDLDTESYYIVEGVLIDDNKSYDSNIVSNPSNIEYYRLPHAIGSIKIFISVLVDIFSKLIPSINKLIKLMKNPSSFITSIIIDKIGEGFSTFSKESTSIFKSVKNDNITSGSMLSKKDETKNTIKNSQLNNYVFIDKKGNTKFLLDGISMIPYDIFGIKSSFGIELNYDNDIPMKLITNDNLSKSKVMNVQDFLKNSLKKYKVNQITNNNNLKYTNSGYEIIDIKYSTGDYINGINYNYIYINEDNDNILNDIDYVIKNDPYLLNEDSNKKIEAFNNALKNDPNNEAFIQKNKELNDKIKKSNDNTNPLLKMLLGLVTLPMKIISSIIEWIMDFFKSLTDPKTLSSKLSDFLSFKWIKKIFDAENLLILSGIKINKNIISKWISDSKIPNYNSNKKSNRYLIPDNFELANMNEFLNIPFILNSPTYTSRQLREHPNIPYVISDSLICFIEKLINSIIDFIWSILGIEAAISSPHINMCDSLSIDKNILIFNGDYSTSENNKNDISKSEFVYDIKLNNGDVIKGLNYDQMQKYIDDNMDINYNLMF